MSKTNILTKNIIRFLNLNGHFAYRVNNIPGTKFRKGTILKGIPDIHVCTKTGEYLVIEIKVNRDRQSPEQIDFEQQIKKRKGLYLIAGKFEDITTNPNILRINNGEKHGRL